jgi:hypothetical protein
MPTGGRFVLGKALRETAESVDSQGRATGSAKADLCRSTLLCPLIASDQQFVKAKDERLLPASTNEYFRPISAVQAGNFATADSKLQRTFISLPTVLRL